MVKMSFVLCVAFYEAPLKVTFHVEREISKTVQWRLALFMFLPLQCLIIMALYNECIWLYKLFVFYLTLFKKHFIINLISLLYAFLTVFSSQWEFLLL